PPRGVPEECCPPRPGGGTAGGAVHEHTASHIDPLVGGTAVKAQVKVLVVLILQRVHHFFWHSHRKRQVAPHLPDHDGCANVASLDLHIVGPMPVATILRTISKGCWELICLCMVHLLVNTLLEVLEDDGTSLCFRHSKPRHRTVW
uniref:Uncharacterized protein n=1 Tax=Denticeps clupeoides TaxID=299321 RepID=A0AAY4BNA5_9TELE